MTVQKISKRGKKEEKAVCYGYIIKLLIRFPKNKLDKITLDFSVDSDCSKLQYWPWSLEDAHLSVGLKAAWGKMQEFSSNAVSVIICSDRIRNTFFTTVEVVVLEFKKCMQLQDTPFIPFRWACLTMLCPSLEWGFLARFSGSERDLFSCSAAQVYINTKVPWWQ